jgi:hypothetical protein
VEGRRKVIGRAAAVRLRTILMTTGAIVVTRSQRHGPLCGHERRHDFTLILTGAKVRGAVAEIVTAASAGETQLKGLHRKAIVFDVRALAR